MLSIKIVKERLELAVTLISDNFYSQPIN